jgi:hypothetical protein
MAQSGDGGKRDLGEVDKAEMGRLGRFRFFYFFPHFSALFRTFPHFSALFAARRSMIRWVCALVGALGRAGGVDEFDGLVVEFMGLGVVAEGLG